MAPGPSPVEVALASAFERDFLPLLQQLGFEPGRATNPGAGLVAVRASRPLAAARRVEATLWCDGDSGAQLCFRLDVVEPLHGVECTRQVSLEVPWPDGSAPRATNLDFSGNQFLPAQGLDRLVMAVAFLAGAFAASVVLARPPELGADLDAAASTPGWQAAAAHAKRLWEARHLRGEIDDRVVPATLVFAGASLVTVDAAGLRLTFRMDTRELDRSAQVSVSRWFKNSAGALGALRLINGARSWDFDLRGQLVAPGPS